MAAPHRPSIVGTAVAFEASLAGVTWLVASIAGIPVWSTIHFGTGAMVLGVAATAVPLAAVALLLHAPLESIRRLIRDADSLVRPIFAGCTTTEFAAIAVAAGVGEELLFRGVIQPLLVGWTGLVLALIISNVLFGMVHLVTRTYALIAATVGLYLGVVFAVTDNLLVPIVVHSLYDFIALVYWLRLRPPPVTASRSATGSVAEERAMLPDARHHGTSPNDGSGPRTPHSV